MMRQMLSCTTAVTAIVTAMAKAAEAKSCCVKTVVCVKNPGPMADVAIRNAAPRRTCNVLFPLFCSMNTPPFLFASGCVFIIS